MAKGYAQTYSMDYSDTFSFVAKMTYFRLFISLADTHNRDLHPLDIKNVFLYRDLQDEVYMEQPLGFAAQGEIWKVCRLLKSLYGLKMNPHAWFGKYAKQLRNLACKKVNMTTLSSIGIPVPVSFYLVLVVYVDDIVITRSDSKDISSLKSFLHDQFHTKDLRMLRHFLCVEVMWSKHGIFLSQGNMC